ncbi:hypothetical protein CBR_g151 [Chara braunii]|uniref:IPT/TIG domain-containing protein n=1 Tax=Chara braunii TaxID=69332 RepID=A0A388JLV9_CHABU|nr:hypothetical protein CBR_g151 [Chara braunii]|eukprot:GBG58751.1 hypothetical protein CBR_g151 [Chara braunii]
MVTHDLVKHDVDDLTCIDGIAAWNKVCALGEAVDDDQDSIMTAGGRRSKRTDKVHRDGLPTTLRDRKRLEQTISRALVSGEGGGGGRGGGGEGGGGGGGGGGKEGEDEEVDEEEDVDMVEKMAVEEEKEEKGDEEEEEEEEEEEVGAGHLPRRWHAPCEAAPTSTMATAAYSYMDREAVMIPFKYDDMEDVDSWIGSIRAYFEVQGTQRVNQSLILGTNVETVMWGFLEVQAMQVGYAKLDLTEWLKVTLVAALEEVLMTQYNDLHVVATVRIELDDLKRNKWQGTMHKLQLHVSKLFATPGLKMTAQSCFDVVNGTHFRYGTISWRPTFVKPLEIEFTYVGAYRRDYHWGRDFAEGWMGPSGVWRTNATQTFNDINQDYTNGWKLKFPTGMLQVWQPLKEGIMCPSPFDSGVKPLCGPGQPEGTIVPHPLVDGENNLIYPAGYPCKNATTNKEKASIDYCAPWSEAYGFFFGDGETWDMELTIDAVNFETNQLGNYLRGHSVFRHRYKAPKNLAFNTPWVAYFTGGNRIRSLNNNKEGRYRLETTVNIQGPNRSPIATNIPVLPVPYEQSENATFQIAAFDPDIDPDILETEILHFRLGTQREMGMLLANANPRFDPNPNSSSFRTTFVWYNRTYQALKEWNIRYKCDGNCSNCPMFWNCSMMPPWNTEVNMANSPPRISIEESTGIVTWVTGQGPYEIGQTGILPLRPGFYNLVVMIGSNSRDTSPNATQLVEVPLDFLLYLYPSMRYCAKGCLNMRPGIHTFRDKGLYGHADKQNDTYSNGTAWFPYRRWYYNSAGTGKCTICGGGWERREAIANHTVCQPPNQRSCGNKDCPGIWLDSKQEPVDKDENCRDNGNGGVPRSLVPLNSTCKINQPPVWVENGTTGHPRGDTPPQGVVIKVKRGKPVTFQLVAHDPDDCTELSIDSTGLYLGTDFVYPNTAPAGMRGNMANESWDMQLEETIRDPPSLTISGFQGRQIRRTFTWPAPFGGEDVDPRPNSATVCFYAFDNYIISKFRCITIQVLASRPVMWMDQRDNLPAEFRGNTPFNMTQFYVVPGNTLVFRMAAIQLTGLNPLFVELTQGTLPEGATFNYENSTLDDPVARIFIWTPKPGQECEYRLCFDARNSNRPVPDWTKTVPLDPKVTSDERCYLIHVTDTVLDFTGGGYVDVGRVVPTLRPPCGMSIGGWFYPRGDGGPEQNHTMPLLTAGYKMPDEPFTIVHGVWWQREILRTHYYSNDSVAFNVSDRFRVAYFDTHGKKLSTPMFCYRQWHFIMLTISAAGEVVLYVDGVDQARYAINDREWHQYLRLTDALKAEEVGGWIPLAGTAYQRARRQERKTTPHLFIGSTPDVAFDGLIDEVRVFARALSAEEVRRQMFQALDPPKEVNLTGYYKFNDGSQGLHSFNVYPKTVLVINDTGAENVTYKEPYHGEMDARLFPLTDYSGKGNVGTLSIVGNLSYEFVTTPMSPSCTGDLVPYIAHLQGGTNITVRGANFAESQWLKCFFNGKPVPAKFINRTAISCKAPPLDYPCSVAVETANNHNVTNSTIALYYLDTALVLNGEDEYLAVGLIDANTSTVGDGVYDNLEAVTDGYSIGMWVWPSGEMGQDDRIVFMLTSYVPTATVISPFFGRSLLEDGAPPEVPPFATLIGVYYDPAENVFEYSDRKNESFAASARGKIVADPDMWHYVMLTVTSERLARLYVDGELDAEFYSALLPVDLGPNGQFHVGGSHIYYEDLDGPDVEGLAPTSLPLPAAFSFVIGATSTTTTTGATNTDSSSSKSMALSARHSRQGRSSITTSSSDLNMMMLGMAEAPESSSPFEPLGKKEHLGRGREAWSSTHHHYYRHTRKAERSLLAIGPFGEGMNFAGMFKDITVWSRNLTACEVVQVMREGSLQRRDLLPTGASLQVNPEDNLVARYRLNHIDGLQVHDSSGHDNHGMVVSNTAQRLPLPVWKHTTLPFYPPCIGRAVQRRRDCASTKVYMEGPGTQEPWTLPNVCTGFYSNLRTGIVSLDGYENTTISGFGFANSPWLHCVLEGTLIPARFLSFADVECNVPALPRVGRYSLGVANMGLERPGNPIRLSLGKDWESMTTDERGIALASYLWKGKQEIADSCNKSLTILPTESNSPTGNSASNSTLIPSASAPAMEVFYPERKLTALEMAPFYDGIATFFESEQTNDLVAKQDFRGMTFGAWFFPIATDNCSEQPIMCFTSECTPYWNGADWAVESEMELCLMTRGDRVYLYSDKVDRYGSFVFNETLAQHVDVQSWHHAEVSIEAIDIEPPPFGAYGRDDLLVLKTSLKVDGKIVDGYPYDIRVPGLPNKNGSFFVGGVRCTLPSYVSVNASDIPDYFRPVPDYNPDAPCNPERDDQKFFRGYIDEVYVYTKTSGMFVDPPFSRILNHTDDLVYFRFNPRQGRTVSDTVFVPKVFAFPAADRPSVLGYMKTVGHDQTFPAPVENATLEYITAPWEPAVIDEDQRPSTSLDGGPVLIKGLNFARSEWLRCTYSTVELNAEHNQVMLTHPPRFSPATPKVLHRNRTYLGPAHYMSSRTGFSIFEAFCNASGADLPGVAAVQLVNPRAMPTTAEVLFRERALSLGGDVPTAVKIVGDTVDEPQVVKLECPAGMRFEEVVFASFGRPHGRCATQKAYCCDGRDCSPPCDTSNLQINEKCHSDNDRPENFTKNIWSTKDFVIANNVTTKLAGSNAYSFGAWVLPRSKEGSQAIISFGSLWSPQPNRALLQWRGLTAHTGVFYYYDDLINDVVMKHQDIGEDLVLAMDQWYNVFVTIDEDNEGRMYVNGFEVAQFSTRSRPDTSNITGTFIIGMDLDERLHPNEYFAGLLDEVQIYNRSLSQDEVIMFMCHTRKIRGELHEGTQGLVSYFRFNLDDPLMAETVIDDMNPMDKYTLARSTETQWNPLLMSFLMSNVTRPVIHTEYEYIGAPWFPSVMMSIDKVKGPLLPGRKIVVTGVNFAPRSTQVFINGTRHLDWTYINDTNLEIMTVTGVGGSHIEIQLSNGNVGACNGVSIGSAKYTREPGMEDLVQGYCAYYPLDGGVAEDTSGYGRHGRVMGGRPTENRDGLRDQAMHFAPGQYAEIPICAPGTGMTVARPGLTITGWFFFDDFPFPEYQGCDGHGIAALHGCQLEEEGYVLRDAWKHVALAVTDLETSQGTIYVNGRELASASRTDYAAPLLKILNGTIGGGEFSGKIDDIRIYSRLLDPMEIMAMYRTQEYALEFEPGENRTGHGAVIVARHVDIPAGMRGLVAVFADETGKSVTNIVPTVDNNFGLASPFEVLSSDGWSVRFTGFVFAPYTADYVFILRADDSVQLSVGDKLLINDTEYSGSERKERGKIHLDKGKWYPISLNYTDKLSGSSYRLQWRTTNGRIPLQVVPQRYLRSGKGPFMVEVWVYPYTVDGKHTVVGKTLDNGASGLAIGIEDGAVSVGVYVGCECASANPLHKCLSYRQARVGKAAIVPHKWQLIGAGYSGDKWEVYVDGWLRDTIKYDTTEYFVESSQPLLLGVESLVPGEEQKPWTGKAGTWPFHGLIDSVVVYSRAGFSQTKIVKDAECFFDVGPPEYLAAHLMLNEGIGRKVHQLALYDSENPDIPSLYGDGTLVWIPDPDAGESEGTYGSRSGWKKGGELPWPRWANSTGTEYKADLGKSLVSGMGLKDSVAGECGVFSITSRDICGAQLNFGGDNWTVGVFGPLHLSTEEVVLVVGNGIVDHGDGTYTATYRVQRSGDYFIRVFLNGEEKLGTKAHVHPGKTAASKSYLFGFLQDTQNLDELRDSLVGALVAFKVQTVDRYGNLRFTGGDKEWAFFFSGPYSFHGNVTDLDNGQYQIDYVARAAGKYQMFASVCGQPICTYGGATCMEGAWSARSYCTIDAKVPSPLNSDKCPFCITVREGGSLSLQPDSVWATFPDGNHLDLSKHFTLEAWIWKPRSEDYYIEGVSQFGIAPIQTNITGGRQYVLSKQSEHSGKGWWLALLPLEPAGQNNYSVEAGVYVGSEAFRILRTEGMKLEHWHHLAVTYDGINLRIFIDSNLTSVLSLKDKPPQYPRRNRQPVRVGKEFDGLIDEVKIFDIAKSEEEIAGPGAFCPSHIPEVGKGTQNLVAYYRFSDRASTFARDSSAWENNGYIGLVCDTADEDRNVTLTCPPRYRIGSILFASFGHIDGTCGSYEVVDGCGSPYVREVMENLCLGRESCTMVANRTLFGRPCRGATLTLAISALCDVFQPSEPYQRNNAPSKVGVADASSTSSPMCVGNMWYLLPDQMRGEINYSPDCAQFSMTEAIVGQGKSFALTAVDACGLNRTIGMQQFSMLMQFDGYVEFFPAENPTADRVEMSTCYPRVSPPMDLDTIKRTWGGAFGDDCDQYKHLYVFEYMPTRPGTGKIVVGVEDATIYSGYFVVVPGPISGSSLIDGPGLSDAWGGIQTTFNVIARDRFANLVKSNKDMYRLTVAVAGRKAVRMSSALRQGEPGKLDVFITYPSENNYTVEVQLDNVTFFSHLVAVSKPMFPQHKVTALAEAGPSTRPGTRFEHSGAAYKDSLYIFGGAKHDKSYIGETWKLDVGLVTPHLPTSQQLQQEDKLSRSILDDEDKGHFSFRVPIEVTGHNINNYTVEVVVDTSSLVLSGMMRPDCWDVMFATWEGEALQFWVDPVPGCNSTHSIFWVRIPSEGTYYLYFGNARITSPPVSNSSIFDFFEDFEDYNSGSPFRRFVFNDSSSSTHLTTTGNDNSSNPMVVESLKDAWVLDEVSTDTCSGPDFQRGAESSFKIVDSIAVSGTHSLLVDTRKEIGGSISRKVTKALTNSSRFILKGFFYDGLCPDASHWISPDFDQCESTQEDKKTLLPVRNGVGVHTASTHQRYASMYPWKGTSANRTVGWHSFAIYGGDEVLKMFVDGMHVARESERTTTLSKIFLRGGAFAYDKEEGNGYWDAIFVLPYDSSVTAKAYVSKTEPVLWNPSRTGWTQIVPTGPTTSHPPARQGHSAVVYDDKMWIFGGERSAYIYNDLWSFSFQDEVWTFSPALNEPPPPRHDHSAAVYRDAMFILGGRSPLPLSDFWMYSFTNRTWSKLEDAIYGLGRLFGHTTVVSGNIMYVYGGYIHDLGELSNGLWEYKFLSGRWIKLGPRTDADARNNSMVFEPDPSEAIVFPAEIPVPRFAHQATVRCAPERGNLGGEPSCAMYIFGGAGGPSMMESLGDIWKFIFADKKWIKLGNVGPTLARYDAAGGIVGDYWLNFGGVGEQGITFDEVQAIFVGDGGL